jgi:hypothetical protein
MKSIQGKPRNQWEMYCLNEYAKAPNKLHPIFRSVDPLVGFPKNWTVQN